jgi:hypothetical protein
MSRTLVPSRPSQQLPLGGLPEARPLWSFLASLLSLLLGLHFRWHLPLLKNSKIGVSLYQVCVQQGPSSQQAMCQSQQPIQCSQMIH